MYKSLCKRKWKMDGKVGREKTFDCGIMWSRQTHFNRETTQKELLDICESCEYKTKEATKR